MSESIRLQELTSRIVGILKQIEHHTHCTSCNTGTGGGGGAEVTVINPVDTPVNVSLVPASLPLEVTVTPTTPTVAITSAGTTSPIPAGFKSIAIVKTSVSTDSFVIAMSDASTYTMTLQGEVFGDSAGDNQTLPAYTITGTGTYKWHGIK